MSRDARGARIVRLIADPKVGGDLLLAAVGLAAWLDFGHDYDRPGMPDVGQQLWPDAHDPAWRIRDVFRRDMRRYKPDLPPEQPCLGPMPRTGRACKKRACTTSVLVDWATGELNYIGACSLEHHLRWFQQEHQANQASKPDVVPLPYANHGGMLVSYFPELDWRDFWRKIDPTWVEHPERHEWPQPRFQLVLGDGNHTTVPGRPVLAVVPTAEESL